MDEGRDFVVRLKISPIPSLNKEGDFEKITSSAAYSAIEQSFKSALRAA